MSSLCYSFKTLVQTLGNASNIFSPVNPISFPFLNDLAEILFRAKFSRIYI